VSRKPLFSFNLEKVAGHGEDADPVALDRGDEWWLGAFDGVGGAGGQMYEVEGLPRTGAYLASRIAARTVHAWIGQSDLAGREVPGLRHELGRALREAAAASPTNGTALRSRMLRPLPTTVAILQVCAPIAASPEFPFQCRAIWAGDSRAYVLRPDRGLVQITRDHLSKELDPFENLTADCAMSNYVSADGEFRLEETYFGVEVPFVGIAASDGCFGYVESPIAFEWMLLDTLRRSRNPGQWRSLLSAAVAAVAGDDASAAVGLFGWKSFPAARADLRRRWERVDRDVHLLEASRVAAEAARDALQLAEQALNDRRTEVWTHYRRDYEGYASGEQS
jgi:hypothetical protein